MFTVDLSYRAVYDSFLYILIKYSILFIIVLSTTVHTIDKVETIK